MELWDSNYSTPKYILHVASGLQFSLHAFNWLLPDIHPLYSTHRQRMYSARVVDFLEAIRDGKYVICGGLRQDEHVQSIAKDPDEVSHTSFSNSDVIRHSIPNKIEMDSNFGVSVFFRCVDCQLLLGRNVDEEHVIYDPCKKLQKNILVQQNRKKSFSGAPAKTKAPLTACSSEKLRATVATRLVCKQLEDKIKNLKNKIEKSAVSIGELLEKNLIRAVARTLIGGGGVRCLFIYSCSARLVSFQIDKFEFDFKRN